MRRLLLLALLLLSAGCFVTEWSLQGVPEGERTWRIGYRDGCHSGRYDAGMADLWEKDKNRYRVDDLYARGWREGYEACRAEATRHIEEHTVVAAAEPSPATPTPVRVPPTISVAPLPEAPTHREAIERRIEELQEELDELKKHLDSP